MHFRPLLVFFSFCVLAVFDLILVTVVTNSQIDRSSFGGSLGGREGESGWLLQNDQTDQSVISSFEGAMSGGFNFQVTDGLNFAPRQIFSITARALIISLEVNRGLSIFPGKILTSLSVWV